MPDEEMQDMAATEAATIDESASDAALEKSIFEDGSDFAGIAHVRLYSFAIKKDGTTFYFKELSEGQQEQVRGESKAIQAEVSRIQKAQKQLNYRRDIAAKEAAKAIEAGNEPLPPVDDEHEEAALADAQTALAQRSLELSEWVLNETMLDWSNPKWPQKIPCTRERRAKLWKTLKTELGDEVLSRSFSGRGVASTLATSS